MKRISAFILTLLYGAYAITSLAGINCLEGDGIYAVEKTQHVDKDSKKLTDFSKLQKIVKHVSTAAKGKTFRSNPAFAETGNDNAFYYFHEDDKLIAVLHPHLEHTPLFLKNCVFRI